jgi:hypothetical protein
MGGESRFLEEFPLARDVGRFDVDRGRPEGICVDEGGRPCRGVGNRDPQRGQKGQARLSPFAIPGDDTSQRNRNQGGDETFQRVPAGGPLQLTGKGFEGDHALDFGLTEEGSKGPEREASPSEGKSLISINGVEGARQAPRRQEGDRRVGVRLEDPQRYGETDLSVLFLVRASHRYDVTPSPVYVYIAGMRYRMPVPNPEGRTDLTDTRR